MIRIVIGVLVVAAGALPATARADQPVGTTFPDGFPQIVDASLGTPVIGFGAAGSVRRTPVIFLHGNNDTPFPTDCNSTFGHTYDLAQAMHDFGYARSELWALGYQGPQCDLQTSPTNKSGEAHSTVANVPDVRAFVQAVLTYTGAKQVDLVGHSLGGTLSREFMRQDGAHGLVRTLIAIDSPHHGIVNCSPSPRNYYALDAGGGFNPDSAICVEYGAPDTPLLARLNAGDETPGPTRYVVLRNADTSFVYFSAQDGAFPPVPPEDREGRPHDFAASAALAGAKTYDLYEQGAFDEELRTAHLGILQSPETRRIVFAELDAATAAPQPAGPPARHRTGLRATARARRAPGARIRLVTTGRLTAPSDGACRGHVGIRVTAGRRAVSVGIVPLRRDCRFRSVLSFRRTHRPLRVRARFFGNAKLSPASARARVRR